MPAINKQNRVLKVDSTPLMKADAIINYFRDRYCEDVAQLWEEFAGFFPDMPAWALTLLVHGKFDVEGDRGIVLRESALSDLHPKEPPKKQQKKLPPKKSVKFCSECEDEVCPECGECHNNDCSLYVECLNDDDDDDEDSKDTGKEN